MLSVTKAYSGMILPPTKKCRKGDLERLKMFLKSCTNTLEDFLIPNACACHVGSIINPRTLVSTVSLAYAVIRWSSHPPRTSPFPDLHHQTLSKDPLVTVRGSGHDKVTTRSGSQNRTKTGKDPKRLPTSLQGGSWCSPSQQDS